MYILFSTLLPLRVEPYWVLGVGLAVCLLSLPLFPLLQVVDRLRSSGVHVYIGV